MDQYYDNGHLNQIIQEAIVEDIGLGDITTESIVSPDLLGHGEMLAKEQGIVAGAEIAEKIFNFIDPELQFKRFITDGSIVHTNTIISAIDGSFGSILKAERTVLNIVQRMSGIATMTAKFVEAVRGTHTKITDTRKTAPGLRLLDKLSVKLGGGTNHRFGLDDMVLIKDNHIAAAGGILQAIELCLNYLHTKKYKIKIEVETKNLDEVKEVLKFEEIRRIMLDNYSIDEMKKAVEFISQRVEVEASGNVTLQNVRTVAETGVDFISVGALTHSPKALDISLKVIHLPKSV
jgi:nicotinate-nucleotide pyrophosphorylase (carboxylating)